MGDAGRDFAALFAPKPAEADLPIHYRQGVIVAWNPVTLANTVLVDGSTVTDLPVLGVAEARTYTVGAVVGILSIAQSAVATWVILGRLVQPGTPGAAEAVSLLSTLTAAANVDAQDGTSSTTFGDLANVGPAVTVTVGPSGRMLVGVSARVQALAATSFGADMTVALTGANVISAETVVSTYGYFCRYFHGLSGGISMAPAVNISALDVFDGLTPGETTVTVKYKSTLGGIPAADFGNRTLVVIAL